MMGRAFVDFDAGTRFVGQGLVFVAWRAIAVVLAGAGVGAGGTRVAGMGGTCGGGDAYATMIT